MQNWDARLTHFVRRPESFGRFCAGAAKSPNCVSLVNTYLCAIPVEDWLGGSVTKFDPSQIEILQDIGDYLRQVREEQAKSLEEIASKTYIPLRLLKAIEAGQATILPEPVFVRGFIRRYAEALGLDGLSLAKEFPLQVAPTSPTADDAGEIALPPPPAQELKPIRSTDRPRSFYPLYLGMGAIALVIVLYGLLKSGLPRTLVNFVQSVLQPDGNENAASTQISASPTAPSPTPVISPIIVPPSPIAPVQVDVSLTANSWMRVTVDGKLAYEGTLPSGTKQTWAGQQAIVIRAGNAGAVLVAFNQGEAKVMGELGQVANQTFTSDSASSQIAN